MYTKNFLNKGFNQIAYFDNDCLHPQFESYFKFSNFRTKPRSIELIQGICPDEIFELYWVCDLIICTEKRYVTTLLEKWVANDDSEKEFYSLLLHQIKTYHHIDFAFIYYIDLEDKYRSRKVGDRIAEALIMEKKIAVYEFGCGYLKTLNYYAHGRMNDHFTTATAYFVHENYTFIRSELWSQVFEEPLDK